MFRILNTKVVSIGVASIIAVGVIGTGSIALANESSSTGAPSAQAANRGSDGAHHGRGRMAVGKILKDAGVTRDELKQGASEGKTIGEIITAYGDKSIDTVRADASAALDTHLAAAVTSGKLTQARADEIKAKAPAAFDKLMASKPGDHEKREGRHSKFEAIGKHALKTVATTLGIEPKALIEQLRAGKTIADVAGAQTGAVTQALTDQANTAIDKAVTDGRLSADKAAEAKAKAAERITRFVNETHKPDADGKHPAGSKQGRAGKTPKAG